VAHVYSTVLNAHCVTSMADTDIDAVKSKIRHINDPVLLLLKMEGVRLLFLEKSI
jgi:hypothetical protein